MVTGMHAKRENTEMLQKKVERKKIHKFKTISLYISVDQTINNLIISEMVRGDR